MEELILKVKKKRGFSKLPDSIVKRALEVCGREIRDARALLHKYFEVFLTNKVLKDRADERILKRHISSKNRDYKELYNRIFSNKKFNSVVDLGCGVNGLSFKILKRDFSVQRYVGIEAVGQVVELVNKFFRENGLKGVIIHEDLFNLEKVSSLIKRQKSPKAIFMFQVIDALEAFEKDYTKKFLGEIKKIIGPDDIVVLSYSEKSLSGKKRFYVKRRWLIDFIKKKFEISDEFYNGIEKFFVFGRKS